MQDLTLQFPTTISYNFYNSKSPNGTNLLWTVAFRSVLIVLIAPPLLIGSETTGMKRSGSDSVYGELVAANLAVGLHHDRCTDAENKCTRPRLRVSVVHSARCGASQGKGTQG